jgi:hypothetical protein
VEGTCIRSGTNDIIYRISINVSLSTERLRGLGLRRLAYCDQGLVRIEVELGNGDCRWPYSEQMAQENFIHNPLLCVVEDSIVAVDVLGGVVSNVVTLGSWIRLCNSGSIGHMLVGCPSLSHSAQGG